MEGAKKKKGKQSTLMTLQPLLLHLTESSNPLQYHDKSWVSIISLSLKLSVFSIPLVLVDLGAI